MDLPEPRQTTVCSSCNLDWDEHIKLAEKEDRDEWSSQADVHDGPWTYPRDQRTIRVYHSHCVQLLKIVNQGPTGPVGPMGASGPQLLR